MQQSLLAAALGATKQAYEAGKMVARPQFHYAIDFMWKYMLLSEI